MMLNDLNSKLAKVKEDLYLKRKWERHLNELDLKKQELEKQLLEYKKQWDEEQEDVDKLEKFTLTNILVTLSGRKLEKYDQEKQEALAARLKYENNKKQFESVEAEIKTLSKQLSTLGNPQEEYDSLLKEKEIFLSQTGSDVMVKLTELDERIHELSLENKEINEAIQTGNEAISSLEVAISTLDEAENWSTWDMFGGGTISTAMKHQALNKAEYSISNAQEALRRFQMELNDINEFFVHGVTLDGFMTFADYFFDGLFVDWSIHGKIQDSLGNLVSTKAKAEEMLRVLRVEQEGVIKQIDDLKVERSHFIEEA